MVLARIFALVSVAACLVAARDTVYTDDLDAGWKFSSGSTRVNDTNEAVHAGGYTVVPVGGTAEVSFVGSGASVYFVTPANTQGSWDFFFDGESIGGVEIVRPIPEISYNERLLSSHGHAVGQHSIKIVARSAVCGVDTLFYNPGPASPDDPDD